MHRLAALSFAEVATNGQLNLWTRPGKVRSYAAGNAEGLRRANELLFVMQSEDKPALLRFVIEAMAAQGDFGPVEIGFFARLAHFMMQADIPVPVAAGGKRQLSLVANDVAC